MNIKRHIYKYRRILKLCMMRSWLLTVLVCAFLLPSYIKFEESGDNYFRVFLNDVEVGTVGDESVIDSYMQAARKRVVSSNTDIVLIDVEATTEGKHVVWGTIDNKETVIRNMANVMEQHIKKTLHHSYTVKINETTVNLGSYEEVNKLLSEALAPYNTNKEYEVSLIVDNTREVNVLTTQITRKNEMVYHEEFRMTAGVEQAFNKMFEEAEADIEKSFDEYSQGLVDIGFAEAIEIVEAYLLEDKLSTVEKAVDLLTKEQETQIIYKVVSGDTLSHIALKNNIPLEDLIAINPAIDDENSVIRVDQEILINVPEPALSVIWKEQSVYIEEYDAEVEYIPNDSWYTTQRKTLQEPSAGVRKVVAINEYKNGQVQGRDIIKEHVYADAVAKVVERGTKIPPTYIKPIYGGRVSSGFGARSAPTKGASTYHKGVDWATPIGTPVMASNAGTVVTAGWVSGYGYAVYINHADGRQTRYGHLSKVLVKPGQVVAQGERIALSGNTGRSTGPHLHFEIRVGGTAINPLKNLN